MKAILIGIVVAIALTFVGYHFWGPKSWNVAITGVTGDGGNVQYRVETVQSDGSTLVFINEDARLLPPYFKPDSSDVQAEASRVAKNCSDKFIKVDGYGIRFSWMDWFPNITDIEAPSECLKPPAPSSNN